MACHRRPMARTTATTRAIEMAPIVSAESDGSLRQAVEAGGAVVSEPARRVDVAAADRAGLQQHR